MQNIVHLFGGWSFACTDCLSPAFGKGKKVCPPAFKTWAMPGRERTDLIKEEELRVAVPHHLTMTIVELGLTAYPLFAGPAPIGYQTHGERVMDPAATIAHQCASHR